MGCDIHMRAEVRKGDEWELVGEEFDNGRDYAYRDFTAATVADLPDGHLLDILDTYHDRLDLNDELRALLQREAETSKQMRERWREDGVKHDEWKERNRAYRARSGLLTPEQRDALVTAGEACRPYNDETRIDFDVERQDGERLLTSEPYGGRNYDLFAMLADVRNGGFRGEPRRIEPIDEPRGIPDDASAEAREFLESYGVDGHSHSWFTLAELEAVDWHGSVVNQWGILNEDAYQKLRATGEEPTMWSGGSWGDRVQMFTPEGFDAWVAAGRPPLPEVKGRSWLDNDVHIDPDLLERLLADKIPRRAAGDDPLRAGPGLLGAEAPEGHEPFGLRAGAITVRADATGELVTEGDPRPITSPRIRAQWTASWADSAGAFVTTTLKELAEFADRQGVGHDAVRLIFFFDN